MTVLAIFIPRKMHRIYIIHQTLSFGDVTRTFFQVICLRFMWKKAGIPVFEGLKGNFLIFFLIGLSLNIPVFEGLKGNFLTFALIGLSLNLAMEWDLSLWYKHLPPGNCRAFNVPVTGIAFFFWKMYCHPFWCKKSASKTAFWHKNGSRSTVKQVEINIQMDCQKLSKKNNQKAVSTIRWRWTMQHQSNLC